MYIREISKTIFLRDKENLWVVVGLLIRDSGIRAFKKVRELRLGLIIHNTKVIIREEKNTVLADILGLMVHNMMEIGRMGNWMVLGK